MLDFSQANIRHIAVTYVGNKDRYEGVVIPQQLLLPVNEVAQEVLLSAFLKPFARNEEFFFFHHDEDVSNHPIYQQAMSLFSTDQSDIQAAAEALTQRLYENVLANKLSGGEFLIALIDDVLLGEETTQAIGLIRVHDKETFLKFDRSPNVFTMNVLQAISIRKPQVAALIFNLDEAEGYRVCAIDTITKKGELSYWKDEFLRIYPIEDHYFNTKHYINLASEFITQRMPKVHNMDMADQADLLNRSALYFKEHDQFEVEDFSNKLFEEEEQKASFMRYRDEYTAANQVPLTDEFEISNQAVRKQAKAFKSVIKLDQNFHIYVHGRRDWIERGFDDDKKTHYYKVFFKSEE